MSWEFALDPLVLTALASVRLIFMLQVAPLFRDQGLPVRLRFALAFMLAGFVGPFLSEEIDWRSWSLLDLSRVMLVEASVGLLIGIAAEFFFVGLSIMGNFISTQGGLSAARVVDPSSGVSSTALARMFNGFGMLIFVAIGGHHALIQTVMASFERMPLGVMTPDLNSYLAIVKSASIMFEIGVRIAAPITVAIFIQNVATGVLSKSLQQLNLMVVQLPAHIAILLLIIGLGAQDFVDAIKDLLETIPGLSLAILFGAA